MGSTLLLALLAAGPARVATAEWVFSGVEKPVGDAFVDRFASKLARHGVKVTTQRDIAQVLGLERQKQLTGCSSESTSCLAELAGALGVDAVLAGSVVKVGSAFTVTLRAIASGDGRELASATERLKNEDAVQDWLDVQAESLADRINVALHPDTAPAAGVSSSRPLAPLFTMVAGGALLAGAIVASVIWGIEYSALVNAPPGGNAAQIQSTRSTGEGSQWASIALYAGGAVVLAAGLVWAKLAGSSSSGVSFVPLPSGGAWAGWTVSLP